ncbi:hypothetical protein PUN28_002989 [Cardiocondyla obscurior]|uniref:Uncharacterized protein n=1 Tax=Cardiocondyla obscurior TaxID=286306 RepID=A0AAW2GWX5_9HYME
MHGRRQSLGREDDASDRSRTVENRHGNRRRRGSARTIEEVVTNKVAEERIRVADRSALRDAPSLDRSPAPR